MMRALFAVLALTASAFASDITGDWKATAEGPGGQMIRTFKFKVDGKAVTGETVSSIVGKSKIDNGQLDGDKLTFSVHIEFQGNEMTVNYIGTVVSQDKITLKVGGLQGGEDFEWVATRVK